MIDVTMYDRVTRRIRMGWRKTSHMQTLLDQCAADPTTGFLIGDFTDKADTHTVHPDADSSDFAHAFPEVAALYLVPIES